VQRRGQRVVWRSRSERTRAAPFACRDRRSLSDTADATGLPVATNAVTRVFAGHLYGHLEPDERSAFLGESRRVGDELVILDSGLPPGANAEEWQRRTLRGGTTHTVYKRHFNVDALATEIGGEPLFGGRYYVLVRAVW